MVQDHTTLGSDLWAKDVDPRHDQLHLVLFQAGHSVDIALLLGPSLLHFLTTYFTKGQVYTY